MIVLARALLLLLSLLPTIVLGASCPARTSLPSLYKRKTSLYAEDVTLGSAYHQQDGDLGRYSYTVNYPNELLLRGSVGKINSIICM